ncbi:MAG TPA: glutathione S-transferase N-terminal domain-containing protein [Acidocella sp.]|nr:glutathione S-transferase N-terminal domain-containing protein [Acidocella sp.]
MSITLYYFPTPNGRKVSIALEEMGLGYKLQRVNILEGEQAVPEFLAVSPNGRIPGLTDELASGEPVTLFESGAILQYLGRKSGQFYPQDEVRRTQVDAWVFWQMAGLGPMTGQVTWFRRAAAKEERDPRDTSFAIHRYEKEMRRLYDVLETRLAGRDYICRDYSIADMASWPWVNQHYNYLGELQKFPHIFAWHERILARPAVQKALSLGLEGLSAR